MYVRGMLVIEGNEGNALPFFQAQLMASEAHLFSIDLMACLSISSEGRPWNIMRLQTEVQKLWGLGPSEKFLQPPHTGCLRWGPG